MDVKAYAKINVSLDVTGKREDGYHEMMMVMLTVPLCDDMTVEVSDGDGAVDVKTDLPYIPNNGTNIAGKAASAFMDAAGITDKNVSITIAKHIPVCAGLGGGSSDAAAVLSAMDTMFPGRVSEETLYAIAEKLGSDVPFCLFGGTALASGKGEKLTRLRDFPHSFIVICKPRFSVSTPDLFKQLDECRLPIHPDTAGLLKALEKGCVKETACRCYNVFEDVLPRKHKQIIDSIKDVFISNRAIGAAMSGTGSATYGIFACREYAERAFSELKTKYNETFIMEIGSETE